MAGKRGSGTSGPPTHAPEKRALSSGQRMPALVALPGDRQRWEIRCSRGVQAVRRLPSRTAVPSLASVREAGVICEERHNIKAYSTVVGLTCTPRRLRSLLNMRGQLRQPQLSHALPARGNISLSSKVKGTLRFLGTAPPRSSGAATQVGFPGTRQRSRRGDLHLMVRFVRVRQAEERTGCRQERRGEERRGRGEEEEEERRRRRRGGGGQYPHSGW